MQQASGDYSTYQVTETVGDMTVERHTQSGVDPQCQEPDDDTQISESSFQPHPPHIIGPRISPITTEINKICEPMDTGMEGETSVESSDLISIIKVEETLMTGSNGSHSMVSWANHTDKGGYV